MPHFGNASHERIITCDNRLRALFENVVMHYDCSILEGHRDMVKQNQYYREGRSKVKWPDGKHNKSPSQAVDAAPYISGRGIPWPQVPFDWSIPEQRDAYIKDLSQFYHFAGFVLGMAETLDIGLRWGGDWDMDNDVRDNSFDDLVHFELTGV